MFSLISGLPSGLSSGAFAPSFESFIGTMPLSDSSPPFASVSRLCLHGPAYLYIHVGDGEVSRFSCMLFLRVLRVYDYVELRSKLAYRFKECGLLYQTT